MRFIKSQGNFYRDDVNFVPPIISDRWKLLDTNKNPFYKHSEIELFIAEKDNEIIGRIAAIANYNHNKIHNDKIGFFGFFECINNQYVADKLFDSATDWLKSKGMEIIRGPVNPSMNDEVGLLVENFDDPPKILMTYNPDYYSMLIENYGFKKAKDLFAYKLFFHEFATDKLKRLVDAVTTRNQITIREIDLKNKANFLKDVELIKEIYNKAWTLNWGFVKLEDDELDFMVEDLKKIANQSLAFFVFVKGKPAGFHLALPNYNEIFINNRKGSLLGAAYQMIFNKKKIKFSRIIMLGLLPEYHNTGADAVMYMQSGLRAHNNGMDYGEGSWILEDNEMMNRGMTQTMNGKLYKKYRIYDKSI